MIIKETRGSILDTPHPFIAHGVNCQNAMGSGVAKVLFQKYPQVKKEYHDYCNKVYHLIIESTAELLGTVQFVDCEDKTILNCFTQDFYGYDGKQYVSYEAIKNCFEALRSSELVQGKTIAIPRIGCGLAGGDWETVKKIINEASGDHYSVEVYYL